jgi:hypothetical protein
VWGLAIAQTSNHCLLTILTNTGSSAKCREIEIWETPNKWERSSGVEFKGYVLLYARRDMQKPNISLIHYLIVGYLKTVCQLYN